MDEQISSILSMMSAVLDNEQLGALHATLVKVLTKPEEQPAPKDNNKQLEAFLGAKSIEGCSKKTIAYYELTISKALTAIDKPILRMTTQDLRAYLSDYQVSRGSSAVTINNMRRVLSSFFSWLEDEGVLLKSPMRRIKAIKTPTKVKATFTSEQVERMREAAPCSRDLAIIDLLTTTGMRVSELGGLDRGDFDIEKRECVVLGKGNKERSVYFDDRTKMHLTAFLMHVTMTTLLPFWPVTTIAVASERMVWRRPCARLASAPVSSMRTRTSSGGRLPQRRLAKACRLSRFSTFWGTNASIQRFTTPWLTRPMLKCRTVGLSAD